MYPRPLAAIAAVAQDEIFVAERSGGTIFRNAAVSTENKVGTTPLRIGDIWADGPTNVVAVGEQLRVGAFNGTTWTWSAEQAFAPQLAGVGGAGSEVFAVGEGTVLARSANWTQIATPPDTDGNGTQVFNPLSLWAISATEFVVVGEAGVGNGEIHHFKNGS